MLSDVAMLGEVIGCRYKAKIQPRMVVLVLFVRCTLAEVR